MSEIKYEIIKTAAPSALSGTSPKYDEENLGCEVIYISSDLGESGYRKLVERIDCRNEYFY